VPASGSGDGRARTGWVRCCGAAGGGTRRLPSRPGEDDVGALVGLRNPCITTLLEHKFMINSYCSRTSFFKKTQISLLTLRGSAPWSIQ
jgi:hypothetical protein